MGSNKVAVYFSFMCQLGSRLLGHSTPHNHTLLRILSYCSIMPYLKRCSFLHVESPQYRGWFVAACEGNTSVYFKCMFNTEVTFVHIALVGTKSPHPAISEGGRCSVSGQPSSILLMQKGK